MKLYIRSSQPITKLQPSFRHVKKMGEKSRHLHLQPAGDTKVEDLKGPEQNKGASVRLWPPELLSDKRVTRKERKWLGERREVEIKDRGRKE